MRTGGWRWVTCCSRRALLAGSASGAALLAFPRATWSAEPARGGRLVVAANSEPTNLNPAIVASNGVFFVASKVIEPLAEASYEGKDGLRRGSPPRGRDRPTASRSPSSCAKASPGTTASPSPPPTSPSPRSRCGSRCRTSAAWCSRTRRRSTRRTSTPRSSASRPRRPFQLIRNALPALTAVVPKHIYDGTDIAKNPANEKLIGTGPYKFAEHKPGEYYLLKRNEVYWDKEQPYLDEIVYPGAARPRRGRQRAGGGPDPARRLLRRAARRSRPDLEGAGPQGLCQRL